MKQVLTLADLVEKDRSRLARLPSLPSARRHTVACLIKRLVAACPAYPCRPDHAGVRCALSAAIRPVPANLCR
jgi:hypothetical protein